MNLQLTGHHIEITPAIRAYVTAKFDRINRHFERVIEASVVLSVDKLQHMAEGTLHVRGRDLHSLCVDADLYAAVVALDDKLDRQVVKHKEQLKNHRADPDMGRAAAATSSEGEPSQAPPPSSGTRPK
jgi:putative sigma-54 modulation protein